MTKVIKKDRLPQYHLTAPCVPVLPVPASAVGTITRPVCCELRDLSRERGEVLSKQQSASRMGLLTLP